MMSTAPCRIRCLTGYSFSHVSARKHLYYHLGQLLQFREPHPAALLLGFLVLQVNYWDLGRASGFSIFNLCPLLRLVHTGRPGHGLTHHHHLPCELFAVASLLLFLLLALLFCNPVPGWELIIYDYPA